MNLIMEMPAHGKGWRNMWERKEVSWSPSTTQCRRQWGQLGACPGEDGGWGSPISLPGPGSSGSPWDVTEAFSLGP